MILVLCIVSSTLPYPAFSCAVGYLCVNCHLNNSRRFCVCSRCVLEICQCHLHLQVLFEFRSVATFSGHRTFTMRQYSQIKWITILHFYVCVCVLTHWAGHSQLCSLPESAQIFLAKASTVAAPGSIVCRLECCSPVHRWDPKSEEAVNIIRKGH